MQKQKTRNNILSINLSIPLISPFSNLFGEIEIVGFFGNWESDFLKVIEE